MHASSASIASPRFNAPVTLHARGARPARAILFHAAQSEIYAQGEQAGALYRIEYGAVHIYRLLADGRRQVVAFHIAGETFGFEARKMHSFFAESIVPTGLVAIDAHADGRYGPDLVTLALRNMVRAQEHLLVLGRQNSVEKVAVFLVDLNERQGGSGHIDLPMTRTDIGDYLGMTIETASRSLSKLRDMGILRITSTRTLEIIRADRLRLLAE
jgi:CRP/FNR family nitrogen fixation transcriptional regulator